MIGSEIQTWYRILVLAFRFDIDTHVMLIMIGSKDTKLLENFEYMQFQKTHKCEMLISDGQIYGISQQRVLVPSAQVHKNVSANQRLGGHLYFPIDRPGKHKLGWGLGVLAFVQCWYLASCEVSLHSGSMNINGEYSQVKFQMLLFLCFSNTYMYN